jgi:hypothetical protein
MRNFPKTFAEKLKSAANSVTALRLKFEAADLSRRRLYGLVVRFRLLSTHPLVHAVAFSYGQTNASAPQHLKTPNTRRVLMSQSIDHWLVKGAAGFSRGLIITASVDGTARVRERRDRFPHDHDVACSEIQYR